MVNMHAFAEVIFQCIGIFETGAAEQGHHSLFFGTADQDVIFEVISHITPAAIFLYTTRKLHPACLVKFLTAEYRFVLECPPGKKDDGEDDREYRQYNRRQLDQFYALCLSED